MREFTIPSALHIAEDANLTDAVWTNAHTHPTDGILARDATHPSDLVTTAQFRDAVAAVAKGLIAAGIQHGDRVALMSRTRFEWTLFDFAIWAAGAVTVPIYDTSSADQTQWMMSNSGAVAAIVETPRHAVTVAEVREQLPSLRTVWQIDADPTAETVLVHEGRSVSDEQLEERRTSVNADDLATIIYTSGTTGRPKGCELTHRNFLTGAGNALALFANDFNSTRRTVLFLPLAHVLAREIQVCAVIARAKVAYASDPKRVVEAATSFQPTILLAVPRVFDKLYNGAKQKAYSSGKRRIFDAAERTAIAYSRALDEGGPRLSLRIKHSIYDALVYRKIRAAIGGKAYAAISGGAPLGEYLGHFFRGIGVMVWEGWGLTETTAAATVNRANKTKVGTVGQPLPGTTIATADDGEVLVKGDIVSRGYWKGTDNTAVDSAPEAFDADGWFHTGDLGALDNEGYLSITGRKKEIIVTAAGKNVAPAPLEEQLNRHPLISQCMVIGDNRPFIACLITLDVEMLETWQKEHNKTSDATVETMRTDSDLRAELQATVDSANASVSHAEQIKAFRILPADFTVENGLLTPSLKVKRDNVAQVFADDITAIYE